MAISNKILDALRTPLEALSIVSEANSFEENRVLGSKRLNRWGLHRWRVKTAMGLAKWRRSRIAPMVRDEWRDQFARDGFVMVENALPLKDFEALRSAILDGEWVVRDMTQGDTITRRAAVDPSMLNAVPALRRLLSSDWYRWLVRYVASYDVEPLHYVQAVIKKPKGAPDPQLAVHADTFHPSMKAWLFLDDVEPGEGAFTYVRGSHRLTPERLAWEHEVAQELPDGRDRLTRRGSFRASPEDLAKMGLPAPEPLAVKANTLVVADTFGFHARGASGPDLKRVEIWAYSRRNPFLPWLGGDPLSLAPFASRRVDWLWRLRDRFPKLLKQPWKPAGTRQMLDTSKPK